MTQKNNEEVQSMARTLDRYASRHRLFPDYEYTSCVIQEYVDMQDHLYTFCLAPYTENSKLVSLSRCATCDTPSKIKGQNQSALNLNKGDVVFNYRDKNTIASFTFFDHEDEQDTITLDNIDKLDRPILHTRHACFLLSLSYSLARDYTRNGHSDFSIYNIPHIVDKHLSSYFKFAEKEYKESLAQPDNAEYREPGIDLEIEYWEYLDLMPTALLFVRYAFYYYLCMINNLQHSDYLSLNQYVYDLWTQDLLDYPEEITVPYVGDSFNEELGSMH